MKTLLYLGPKHMEVVDQSEPSPAKGEVKISVTYVGICGSDVHGYLGTTGRRTPPMIMGHEFSGVVAELGEGVQGYKVGDKVIVMPILNCGVCDYCKSGNINICKDRKFLGTMDVNGAFAQYLCIGADKLLKLPDTVSIEQAAMVEPLAVAYGAVRKVLPITNKVVLISGAGTIGLMLLKVVRYFGAKTVIVVDLSEDRLAAARAAGADITIDPRTQDMEAVLTDSRLRHSIDVTIEAVGVTPTAQQTINYARNMGDVLWVGNSAQMIEINMQQIVTRELVVHGTYIYNQQDYEDALALLAEGKIDIGSFVSAIVGVDEAVPMFERLSGGDTTMIKVLVDMRR